MYADFSLKQGRYRAMEMRLKGRMETPLKEN